MTVATPNNDDIQALFYLDEEDEYLIVNKTLACAVGLNESIALRRVHKWIKHNNRAKSEKHFHDGVYWCFNTVDRWQENEFEFWSVDTVRRTFAHLEALGLLITGSYNERKGDQTKWYTVNYSAYLAYLRLWLNHQRPTAGNGRKSPAYVAFLEDWEGQRKPYATCINGVEQLGNLHKADTQVAQTVTNVLNTTKRKEKDPVATAPAAVSEPPFPPPGGKERSPRERKKDPLFDAIAEAWGTTAGGFVGTIKSMLLGNAKRKAWAACNFESPPSPQEVLDFGQWARRMNPRGQMPTVPETIQRQFYQFRAEQTPRASILRPPPDERLFLTEEELDAIRPTATSYLRFAQPVGA